MIKTTKLTFERAYGLKFGAEASTQTTSSRSFSNSREETVSWSVPVRVPPHTRIVATSTWRKYRDVRVDDLKHDFAEARID